MIQLIIVKRILYILSVFVLVACSTTSNLPEDEYLYTGIKEIKVEGKTGSLAEQMVLEEVEGALAYAPNNSLFGSSTMRTPLPIGLWVYNSMGGKEHKGLKKWFFNVFGATPRTISMAAPLTRTKVAQNVLQNYGYFQGKIDYRLIPGKNPRTQKIAYDINLGQAYHLDSIRYDFPEDKDSIIQATAVNSFIKRDKQFSVSDLLSEKSRLASEFHNNGYYYYRPDYINYYADTLAKRGSVTLLVQQTRDLPARVSHTWKFGRMSAFIRKSSGLTGRSTTTGTQQRAAGSAASRMAYDDTLQMRRLTLAYQGKQVPIKPRVMFRNFKFWTGRQYSEERVSNTVTALSNMGIFSGVNFTFTPRDTTDTCSVLDVRLDATMDKLIDTEVELNFSQKSNSQVGPDASVTFSRRNAFRYGETFSVKLRGAYFWQTRDRNRDMNDMDTYQYGADVSLSYPWTVFPTLNDKRTKYPTSTKFVASFTRENVASFYRINRLSVGVDYNFQSSKYESHTFTPISVTLSDLRHLKSDVNSNQVGIMGVLTDEYIPAIQYSYTYDNSSNRALGITTNFSATVKESGNLISGVQSLLGKDFNEKGKRFVFDDYSQFLKATFELRNKFKITEKSCVATRALLGMLYSYGNSDATPTSEWFYIGGANSVRAFGARTLGSGATPYPYGDNDVYLYHGGDMRIEANAEYRFPMFGDVYGAFFLDAGNVWRLQDTQNSSVAQDGQSVVTKFSFGNFFDQLALGTGLGFRYDMEFLVLRFDVGVAIHAPYETGKKGYYNIPRFFKDGVAFHFAVGYPF